MTTDYPFLRRCNGYKFNPEIQLSYVEDTETFKKLLPHCREVIKTILNDSEYHFGMRFNEDVTVMIRIESALKDVKEFKANPEAWIMDALRDCAGADHWYEYEKDWGMDNYDDSVSDYDTYD